MSEALRQAARTRTEIDLLQSALAYAIQVGSSRESTADLDRQHQYHSDTRCAESVSPVTTVQTSAQARQLHPSRSRPSQSKAMADHLRSINQLCAEVLKEIGVTN